MAAGYPNLLSAANSDFDVAGQAWVASGGNTTLSVVTAQFLTGNSSLRLAPTAAGTVAAISPRCLVTAGLSYMARVPVRTSAATAGKVSTVRITWFDAPSGGSSLGVADGTLALGTAIGWLPDNYTVSFGVAPAGAMSATVKITVDGVAAAEFVNIDAVYMVRYDTAPGNVLDLNDASIEGGTAGWAITGATKGRTSNSLINGSGFACMVMESTAAAQSVLSLAAARPVTVGTEYLGYGWVFILPTFASSTVTAELQWQDAGGTPIGTAAAKTWTVVGNGASPVRLNVVGVAPVGATQVVLRFLIDNPAVGQRMYAEEFFLGVAPNSADNLLSYDEYSSEMQLPPWTVVGATIDQAPLYLVNQYQDGAYALRITPTGDDLITLTLDRLIPVTEAETYLSFCALWAFMDSITTRTITGRTRMDWFDSAGEPLAVDNPDQYYTAPLNAAWGGITLGETREAPAGAAFGRFAVEIDPADSSLTEYYLDNVSFRVSTPLHEIVVSDEFGSVTLTIFALAAQGLTGTYSVTRVHQDGSMHPVRGYVGDLVKVPYTQSPMVFEDYEAPLGENIWYFVDWFAAGTGLRTQQRMTQVIMSPRLADGDYVWFKNPGVPAFNVVVMMETAIEWTRVSRSATLPIVGRKNPVNITQARSGGTASLNLLVWDEPSHELLNALLDPGAPALIQAMPGYGVDGNLYVSVGDAGSAPIMGSANEPGWRWTLAVTEIDRPVGGLQGSADGTWQDPYDDYADWGALADATATWADILLA